MEDNILQKLKNIYVTLNEVEVKGDSNITYMYGSLSTLREVINGLEASNQNTKLQKGCD